MVFFVSILNLKIFARVLKCKTLQTQGVQEVIKSINRAKIQVRILRFKFLALPMTFYWTLNKSLSLDFPISKVIIFSLLLSHKNSGRLSLRKLKKYFFHRVSLWGMFNRDRTCCAYEKRQWDYSELMEPSGHIDSTQTSILSFLFIWQRKTLTLKEQVMASLGTVAITCTATQNNGAVIVT